VDNLTPAPKTGKGKKPVKHGKIFTWVIILIILALLLGTLGLRAIGAVLIIADPLHEADAAVALTGDEGDRVSAAIELYKSGYVDAIFITFTDPVTRDTLVNAAQWGGFPSQNIHVTEMTVSNTVDEARAVRQLAQNENIDSLIIITDPYHTLRTRVIFRRELKGSNIALQVRPVSGHWYRSNTWWKSEEGIRYTFSEYVKIILYFFGVN